MVFTFYFRVASETCRRSFESDTSPLRPNAYRERLLEQKLFNRKRHQGKDKDEEFVVSLQVSDGENRWRPILEDEWIKPSMLILVKRLPYDYAIGRIHTVKLSAAYPAITFSKQTRVVSLENLDTEDDKITEVINLAGHEDSEKLDPVIPLYEDPSLVPRDVNYVCHICQQKGHERRNCPIANDGLTGKSCDKITSVMKTLPSGIPMRDLEEVSHQHVAQAEYKTVDGKLYKRKIDHVPTDNVARCCYCSIRYCNDQKLGAHTTVQTPCCQKFICHSCYQWAGFNSSLTVCLKCKKTVWQD